jgi:hypothetical protein
MPVQRDSLLVKMPRVTATLTTRGAPLLSVVYTQAYGRSRTLHDRSGDDTGSVGDSIRRDDQFRSALASRDVIGQAKGMVMERFGIDAVSAFELLRKLSRESNTRAELARRVVDERFSEPR